MASVIRGDDDFDSAGGNAVKAWVNFNGTGTVAIRADYNVSSITDNGTGDYTINFTTALADADYGINVSAGVPGGPPLISLNTTGGSPVEVAPTVSAFRFYLNNVANTAQIDAKYINAAILR